MRAPSGQTSMQSTRKVLKISIFVLIALFLVADLVVMFPKEIVKVPMAVLHASGRSGFCEHDDSLRALEELWIRANTLADQDAAAHKVHEDGRLTLWETKNGPLWVPTRDGMDFTPLLAEQDRKIYGDVHPGDVVIDAGANIGDFTRTALNAGAALVVAVEIAPDTLDALRRNMADEIAAGKVIVYDKGVSDSDSTMMLTTATGFGSGLDSVFDDGRAREDAVEVQLTTIDKIVEELNLPHVDLIKLDVEGAEVPGVVGASRVIERDKPRLVFDAENFRQSDIDRILEELHKADPTYRMRSIVCTYIYQQWRIRADVIDFQVER